MRLLEGNASWSRFARYFCLFVFSGWAGILYAGQHSSELAAATRELYRGDYNRAASLAEAYVNLHPSSADGLSLLARAQLALGRYQEAFEVLRKAYQSDPRDADVLYYLSQTSTIMAQQEFQRLQRLAPNSFRVHQLRAESYLAVGNRDEAAAEYAKALKLNPRSLELLVAMGDLERSEFHFKQACEYYSQALRINPRSYAGAYGTGVSYLFLQNPTKAIPYFRRAITASPESSAAHFGLGDALLRSGQIRASVAELKEAINLEPQMRQAYTLLAQAYSKLGMLTEANKALAESQRLAREEIKSRQEVFGDGARPYPSTK